MLVLPNIRALSLLKHFSARQKFLKMNAPSKSTPASGKAMCRAGTAAASVRA
jgi:hypothetical protein